MFHVGVICFPLKMIGFEKILSKAKWYRQEMTPGYNIVAILWAGAHTPPFTHSHISRCNQARAILHFLIQYNTLYNFYKYWAYTIQYQYNTVSRKIVPNI